MMVRDRILRKLPGRTYHGGFASKSYTDAAMPLDVRKASGLPASTSKILGSAQFYRAQPGHSGAWRKRGALPHIRRRSRSASVWTFEGRPTEQRQEPQKTTNGDFATFVLVTILSFDKKTRTACESTLNRIENYPAPRV